MQAAAALRPAPEPETVPIEWLPDELLELLFRFADPKSLLMAIPAVSARGGRGNVVTPTSRPGGTRWADALRARASVLDWRARPLWDREAAGGTRWFPCVHCLACLRSFRWRPRGDLGLPGLQAMAGRVLVDAGGDRGRGLGDARG